jgi:hypothetical protein
MSNSIHITKTIDAPISKVFNTVADIRSFSEAIPNIIDVEFLSDQKNGKGTRFKETREFNGREATTILEVTDYQEDQKIQLISDSGGTVWDSIFEVQPDNEATRLTLHMEARPHKWWAYLLNWFMKGIIKRAVERDMDAVKKFCEGSPSKT